MIVPTSGIDPAGDIDDQMATGADVLHESRFVGGKKERLRAGS